jgi:polyisoprenoid-binding protein YceI
MNKSLTLLIALCAWALNTAQAQTSAAAQKIVAAQSDIAFVSKQLGVPVEGHFKKFEATLNINPTKPEASQMSLVVDTGSASLGVPETDAELPKPNWFNVPKFPQATFQSSAVKNLGAGKWEVTGKLAIKGNSRDVVVPVQVTQTGAAPNLFTVAQGNLVIKRLAFKIGENEWADTSMVADDVQVKFKLTLSGVGKINF